MKGSPFNRLVRFLLFIDTFGDREMIRSISILFSIAAVQSIISAAAYELSPIVAQFSSDGPGSSRSFVIRNTHQQPIALQISEPLEPDRLGALAQPTLRRLDPRRCSLDRRFPVRRTHT